ncbi:MAG: hypothetical protein J5651_00450 [Salinivirgaceae bacterium]|nr:hypothetical protein [Salinivirgaceae bacterium]
MTLQQKAEAEARKYHKEKYNCDGVCPDFIKGTEWAKEQYEKKFDEAIKLAHEALKGTNGNHHTTDCLNGNDWAEKIFDFFYHEF